MSTNISTRFLDHRRRSLAQRQQRRRTAVLAALAVSAALAAAWWVATGPVLRVHSVTISGYTQSDQADVVAAIQAGAATGDALHLPVKRIRQAVAPMPWVDGVSVYHDWPRGVRVIVREARPAMVAVAGGKRWLVSTKGRILGGADGAPGKLPEMSLVEARAGEWLKGDNLAPVTLSAALSPDVSGQVRDLHVDGSGLLIGRLAGSGTQLRLGPPVDLWRKGRALDAILANDDTKALAESSEYVDFSTADAPVFGDSSEASTTGGGSDMTLPEVSTSG